VWHTAAGNAGYQFQFSRSANGREALGAPHGSEVPFVFGVLPASRYDAKDHEISAAMQEYWTNFAKTGDPNGGKLPRWPRFEPAGRAYLDFTNGEPVVKEGLRREVCGLFEEKLRRDLN
jgi:para-nitrobenzyl esterase